MAKDKIKIGVLGMANIALRSVIPAIVGLKEQFQLTAVATRQPGVKEFPFKDVKVVQGYEQLLNHQELDAVYIPLPNALHYEWVKKSLQRGLHVLVEKSIACTQEEVAELNHLAAQNNLVLIENFQFRFHTQWEFILSLLAAKELGELRIVRSAFCFPPFSDKSNIRYKKELGGGALLDAGAYPIKVAQLLLGNNLEVKAAKMNFDKSFGVDIWGGACLQQRQGPLFAQIAYGFDNFYQCNIELVGTKGKLTAHRIFTANEQVKPKISIERPSTGLQETELGADNHFQKMLLYFYAAAQGQKDIQNEYADNINQARLIQEVITKNNE